MDIVRIERGGRKPPLPEYKSSAAAAVDLSAFLDDPIVLSPGGRAMIPTGLRVAVPEGMAGLVLCRSSMGAKHGVCLSNGVGLIDPDYRGEVQVALHNTSDVPFTVCDGDRIAQFMLISAPQFALCERDELNDTERGTGGFGSTGK